MAQELLPLVAQQKFACTNIILGVAIVENAYDQTMLIEAIKPDQIIKVTPPARPTVSKRLSEVRK